jgi:alpha-L-fucosidase
MDQPTNPPVSQSTSSRAAWFSQARYGMFIHWGAYSAAARGEWVMNRERIPRDEYAHKYVDLFRAERYDPRQWAALARSAGMKYVVLTARHHDGFALWDTATTDFNAARMGPRRDLVGPFVRAVRDAGLRVGLYLSAADWTHGDYPGAFCRDWPTGWSDEAARKRFVAYYQAQLEELLTRYGKIDVLWYDGCVPQPLDGAAANALARRLQPDILINERNGEPYDFCCSEQSLTAKEGSWEACMTLNGNWGYHAGDRDWKSAREVIRMLVATAGKAGNLLLNVGPKADGTIPEPSVRILAEAGDWLARNGEWLADSGRSPFTWNNSSMVTVKGGRVYLHMFHSSGPEYCWAELRNKVLSARLLDGGRDLTFEQRGPRVVIRGLPWPLTDPIATTIVLEVEGAPAPATEQTTFWIPD